jgi:hypothetical protein
VRNQMEAQLAVMAQIEELRRADEVRAEQTKEWACLDGAGPPTLCRWARRVGPCATPTRRQRFRPRARHMAKPRSSRT